MNTSLEGVLRAFAVGFLTAHWWGEDWMAGAAILLILGFFVADLVRFVARRVERVRRRCRDCPPPP